MLPKPMSIALAEIADRLDSAGIAYCIGGSAMLALVGFDTSVGDIDVVVDPEARGDVERIFSDHYERQSVEPWRSEWLLRARWTAGGETVGVDVIGGLGLIIDGSLAKFPVRHDTTASLDGIAVALAPLAHWYHLYRVHTPVKAEMIASRLTDDDLVCAAAELGIGDAFSPTLIVRIGNDSSPIVIEEAMSTDQQSSIIEVASPTDVSFDAPGSEAIDMDLLNETLEYIRPALQADGGDLVLLGTEGGKVALQMVGACGGCPLSTMTLTAGIERIVRDRVPGVTEVVSI